MGKPIDITGKKFGKLTVLGVHHFPTLNTTTKITGGLKEKWGKDTL